MASSSHNGPGFTRRPALHGASDFISWTWEMVNAGHQHIGWSGDGTTLCVYNPERLASHILPQYFRRSQYSSWVRALNAYDFHKVGTGAWKHPSFQRGHPEMISLILRKKTPTPASHAGPTAVAIGGPGSLDLHGSARLDPGSDLRTMLSEERTKLWWLAQELSRLEHEVDYAHREEFQQKFDTVRLTQLLLSNLPIETAANAANALAAVNAAAPGDGVSVLEDGTAISGPAITRGSSGTSNLLSAGSLLADVLQPRVPSAVPTPPGSPGTRVALASDPAITLLKNEAATALLQYDLESLLTIGNAPAPERTREAHDLVLESVAKRARLDASDFSPAFPPALMPNLLGAENMDQLVSIDQLVSGCNSPARHGRSGCNSPSRQSSAANLSFLGGSLFNPAFPPSLNGACLPGGEAVKAAIAAMPQVMLSSQTMHSSETIIPGISNQDFGAMSIRPQGPGTGCAEASQLSSEAICEAQLEAQETLGLTLGIPAGGSSGEAPTRAELEEAVSTYFSHLANAAERGLEALEDAMAPNHLPQLPMLPQFPSA